ncbi:MAG: guanylate kinase [Lentimicrobium sp.]|nr:guanylate kinase [Lentimicrobium sp.]
MAPDKQKKLIIVSAPSGAGKTTIVKHLLSCFPDLAFSVSATTRAIRAGEVHGKDYFFISELEFKERIESGDLLEWEEVYKGTFYGTLKSEVDRLMNKGFNVIFDVDVVGGLNIKKEYGENALSVFVSPPSVADLEFRLNNRKTDSAETIRKRIEKAQWELGFAPEFDYILVNDSLDKAKIEIEEKVADFLN